MTVKGLLALVIFVGSLPSLQGQQVKVIYNFGAPGTPANPGVTGTISQSPGANLLSSAPGNVQSVKSAAYEIKLSGKLTVLQNFDASTSSGLTLATDQRFHGTIASGGTFGHGSVFRISPLPFSTVIYQHDFRGGVDGAYPTSAPIQSMAGDFYGTTSGESDLDSSDHGTVYRISKLGAYSVLHSFSGADGSTPLGPLVQTTWGSFYGMTQSGGKHGLGTIFRINSDGNFKVVYDFDDIHGSQPDGSLIQGSDGNLYGLAERGGEVGVGVAFKITPGGTLTVLHSFDGRDGAFPMGGLVEATDGNFYGTLYSGAQDECGSLFRMTSAGDFTRIFAFDCSKGSQPMGTLLQHTNGRLYGQAFFGGSYGGGTMFELNLGLSPFVTFLNVYGVVGTKVTILGQNFVDGISNVYFNDVRAVNPEIHPTYIKAIVPDGATTGYITVTTPLAILTSNKPFIVH